MRIPTLLTVTALSLALLPAALVEARPAGGADPGAAASATKTKKKAKAKAKARAKRKACKKGYVRKTVKVKRKGKTVRVKRCRKKKPKATPKQRASAPSQPGTPTPTGPTPTGSQRLFDPPGAQLEGEAARPFLERYLSDSRFTDCPSGFPSCAAEQRYSHFADKSFFRCKLPQGPDADVASTYEIESAVVAADGSWTFDAVVQTSPRASLYHWEVAIDGTVTGSYKVPGPTPPEQIGPLRYVAGARACGV